MWTDRIVGALDLKEELSPGAFQLSSVVIHNDSVVRRTGSLDITTPRAQWAFAVTFPFKPHAGEGRGDSRSLLVRIDATVKSGRIGIGCVTTDLRTYVSGRLMRIEPGRRAGEVMRVESKWLHDVEQVDVDLFWFCLGDKNEAALIDVTHDRELSRFAFGNRGADVQFASIIRPGQPRGQRERAQ